MTVHDAGGDFAFSGRCGERAWRSGLAGLAKTAAREWPLARVKAIDLECANRPADALAEILADELLCGGDALEVGLSANGHRLALREALRPGGRDAGARQILPENATLVVTGGGRGVTAECVIALAKATPLRLALLGRSALVDEPEGLEGVRGPDLRAALSGATGLRPTHNRLARWRSASRRVARFDRPWRGWRRSAAKPFTKSSMWPMRRRLPALWRRFGSGGVASMESFTAPASSQTALLPTRPPKTCAASSLLKSRGCARFSPRPKRIPCA